MFDLDKWQEIYHSISRHKLRTILTAIGVAWGIFMLVMLMGAGNGLENGVKGVFGNLAKNSMFISGRRSAIPYKGIKAGRNIRFTNDDFLALKSEFPQLKYIAGGTSLGGDFTVSYRTNSGAFQVGGDMPSMNDIRGLIIPKGRFINEMDMREKRKIAVLGPRVVEVLFGKEDPIGKYIKIKGVYFLVVGTFYIDNADGRNEVEKIYIPLATLQHIFNAPNRIATFSIAPHDGVDPEELEKEIKLFLAARHKVSPDDRSAISGWNSGRESKRFNGLFFGINIFVWFVSIGTIIAGIVGVSNIMMIIVKERTREIGIRKALGATPGSIINLIIQESVVITSFAGYTGLVVGVGFLELIRAALSKAGAKNPYFDNPYIDIKIAVFATLILVVAGAIAGLFPALRAARINPIEALRDE
ncbi:MAG: ABC transporter permease [Cytophagaceae bacterium]|jgi:putative ABC transport system permease protein|nr:ABC transporter permease [Cytophagaceae bacterium]